MELSSFPPALLNTIYYVVRHLFHASLVAQCVETVEELQEMQRHSYASWYLQLFQLWDINLDYNIILKLSMYLHSKIFSSDLGLQMDSVLPGCCVLEVINY